MKCPKCNKEGAEECYDEVDIGVGAQRLVYGYECPDCGQLAICNGCGAIYPDHTDVCPVTHGVLI